MTFLPTFQAQNPAISGYSLGWASCTAFAGAMAASFDRQVAKLCTGGQVRQRTGDTSGGLTLAQVDQALNSGWGVNLNTMYRVAWADFAKHINAGQGAILQGWYAPIADSRFDAGRGFRGNHAVFVPPNWDVMDPLADGRYGETYKYHGETYPASLLRSFAGKLNIGGSSYRALGDGLVYASFTRDNVHTWKVSIPTPTNYTVWNVRNGVIASPAGSLHHTGGFSAECTVPRLYPWPGHSSQSLVQLTSGAHAGQFIRSAYARSVP